MITNTKKRREHKKEKCLFANIYDDVKTLRRFCKVVEVLNNCCENELSDSQLRWIASNFTAIGIKLPKKVLITELDPKKTNFLCVQGCHEKVFSKIKKSEEALLISDKGYIYRYVPTSKPS